LGLEQWYISQIIKGLNNEERQSLVKMITDEFINSMSPQDRKDLVKVVLPDIVDRLMAGMNHDDRKDLIGTIMPLMIAQLGEQKGSAQDKKEVKAHPELAREKRQ
jgi:Mg/Co/Ni transporter MgtE